MRYRNQYISTILDNENFDTPFSISNKSLNYSFENDLSNLYEKLSKNLDLLSKKIDDNSIENKNSIKNLEERLNKLEGKSTNRIDLTREIQEKSQKLFDSNIKKINLNVESFLENELSLSPNKNNFLSQNNKPMDYNKKWEEEFKKRGLSLEDDGIYEYEYGEEDMKYEYYTGELPKTKIVKVRGKDDIQTYTKDDISNFIENESKKLALNEVSKLHSQSETTQKAWLANNQRLVELTNIIEAQEKEIRRLSQNIKNKNNVNDNEVSELINNSALKMLRDEYELRISALEKDAGISNNNIEIKKILEDLQKEREENNKLKSMLDVKAQPNPKVEVVVSAAPTPQMDIKTTQRAILDSGRKRKQKYFFEIVEHNSPKITKADLEK